MFLDLSLGVPELPALNQRRLNHLSPPDPNDLLLYPAAPIESEFEAVRRGVGRIIPGLDTTTFAFSVHHGGRSALFDFLSALSGSVPGIGVTWREPHWFGYDQIVNAAQVPFVPANALHTKSCPIVAIACFPNNPDGRDDSEWLLEQAHHIDYLVVDLVYLTLMSKNQARSVAKIIQAYGHKAVFVLSTSKTCATPGLRVGYIGGCNHRLIALTQQTQFDHGNFPSLYNRRISADLWQDSDFVDSISMHYAKLRERIGTSLVKYELTHYICGMFLWIDTPKCPAVNVLKYIADESGFVGSNGLRFGWPTGTRWTLVDGVDYETIASLISKYIATHGEMM